MPLPDDIQGITQKGDGRSVNHGQLGYKVRACCGYDHRPRALAARVELRQKSKSIAILGCAVSSRVLAVLAASKPLYRTLVRCNGWCRHLHAITCTTLRHSYHDCQTPEQEGEKPNRSKKAKDLPATAANRRTDRLLHKLPANTQGNLHPHNSHHHRSHLRHFRPRLRHWHGRDLRKYPTQSSEPGASRPATLAATRSRPQARCPAHWR